jgi:hypothetical protein
MLTLIKLSFYFRDSWPSKISIYLFFIHDESIRMRYYFSIQIDLKQSERERVSSHSVCAFLRLVGHAHAILFF